MLRRVTLVAMIGALLTTATIVSNAAKGQKDKQQKPTDNGDGAGDPSGRLHLRVRFRLG